MAYYKEIVTKAVIGKGKKTKKEDYVIETNEKIDNVLGCWVINHNFRGSVVNNSIIVSGSYDVNIWYSYLNNTKTKLCVKSIFALQSQGTEISQNNRNSSSYICYKMCDDFAKIFVCERYDDYRVILASKENYKSTIKSLYENQ
mgnify:CR=1 FL=1